MTISILMWRILKSFQPDFFNYKLELSAEVCLEPYPLKTKKSQNPIAIWVIGLKTQIDEKGFWS